MSKEVLVIIVMSGIIGALVALLGFYYKAYRDIEKRNSAEALKIVKYLHENSTDLEPEFVELVDKYFWDLI